MAKDSFYFQHDYNARNDRKIAALVKKHKSAGYGVFWIACEMMHEEDGFIEHDDITFGALAKDCNEDVEFVKMIIEDCISEFKLFLLEENNLKSNRVLRNLNKRIEISKSRAIAGKLGANAKQMQANGQQKEAKKEKKERKEIQGIFFDEEKKFVTLADNSKQELGKSQRARALQDDIKPEEILKGQIV